MYHRRWPRWAFLSWIGVAVVTVVLYFHNFATTRVDNPWLVLSHAYLGIRVFLFALGDVVGVQENLQDPPNAGVMAFGIAIFVLAVFVLLRSGYPPRRAQRGSVGIALIVYWAPVRRAHDPRSLLAEISRSIAVPLHDERRISLGGDLPDGPHWNCTSTCGRSPTCGGPSPEPQLQRFFAWFWGIIERVDRRVVVRIALAAMVVQVVCSVPLGLKDARDFHQELLTTASVTANVEHEPDPVVVKQLYFVQSGSVDPRSGAVRAGSTI